MGYLIDYSNEFLCLRFINERGICEVIVSQTKNRASLDFYDLNSIRVLILKHKSQFLENDLKKNELYSWDEQFEMITSNYDLLKKLFSRKEILKTKRTLNDISSSRAKIRYGF